MNKITNKLIVCITGMPGAGKSTVASIAKDLGFMIVNLGDFVRETALNENIEPTASNLRELMIKLRKNHGEGIMAEMASKRIIKSQSKLIVIDGIRSMNEVNVFQNLGQVKILSIHASKQVRVKFQTKRGRSDTPKDESGFSKRDNVELEVGIGESIALADETIVNNQIEMNKLKELGKKVLERWKKGIES